MDRGKRPRDDSDPWTVGWCFDEHRRLEIWCASRVVVSWSSGEVKGGEHVKAVREIVDQFVRWYMGGIWVVVHSDRELTRPTGGRHIYREHNLAADTHADWLMDNGDSGPGAQWETPDLC